MSKVKQLSMFNGTSWVPYDIDASYLGGVAASTYSNHVSSKSNPHGVTKSQVSLGSVVNAGQSATYTSKLSSSTIYFTQNGAYNMYTALKAAIPTYSNGNGISIGTDGKIAVKIGSGLSFDSSGNLIATGGGSTSGVTLDTAQTITGVKTFKNITDTPIGIWYDERDCYAQQFIPNSEATTSYFFSFEGQSSHEENVVYFPDTLNGTGTVQYKEDLEDDFEGITVFSTSTSCNPAYSTDVGTNKTTNVSFTKALTAGYKLRCYFKGGSNSYFYVNTCVVELKIQYLTYSSYKIYVAEGYNQTSYYNVFVRLNNSVSTSTSSSQSLQINVTKREDLTGTPIGVAELYLYKVTLSKY